MSSSAIIKDGVLVNNGTSASAASSNISKAIKASEAEAGKSLDKDAFLQLLVTQMQYQDPLKPTSNTEYISQLATFSSLEQMQNMSNSMDMQRASSLVGQHVYLEVTSSTTGNTTTVEGAVDYVTYSGSKTYLSVNGTLYDFADLKTVADADYTLAVRLADTLVGYMDKLPQVEKLTTDNLNKVEELVNAYNSMNSYQKAFLTSDELSVYTAYAEWYGKITGGEDESTG